MAAERRLPDRYAEGVTDGNPGEYAGADTEIQTRSNVPWRKNPLSSQNPRGLPCDTCNAAPGAPCVKPSGHVVLDGQSPSAGFHAPRRALAGLTDGPIHPDRYIKSGTYQHGQGPSACGERITLNHSANARASDGTPVGWNEEPCPRCKKRVWISDLGPVESPNNSPQPRLFGNLPAAGP